MIWVGKIKDDTRMRPGTTTTTSKDILKVNSTVEAQATIGKNINPMTLVVTRCVEDRDLLNRISFARGGGTGQGKTYITSLDKVPSNEQVLLVRGDLDIMRSDDWLLLIWIVEANWVVKVRNINGGHVITEGQGEVGEFAIICNVTVDSN
jgi:hypothetical protein